MATSPPAYAWDWFARQRLLWREARARLAAGDTLASARYAAVDTRSDVVPMLRTDYPDDDLVRRTVDGVVADIAFLGRTDRSFAALGARNAPRGMRWWWTALTGEDIDAARTPRVPGAPRDAAPARQLVIGGLDTDEPPPTLDDVFEGYGG